jgi:hypothetical protein
MNLFHQSILIFSVVVLSYLVGTGKIQDHTDLAVSGFAIGMEPISYDQP